VASAITNRDIFCGNLSVYFNFCTELFTQWYLKNEIKRNNCFVLFEQFCTASILATKEIPI
jgi:hypothetical protein